MNMLRSSSSHRAAETWAPVCLPRYSPNGFLNVYTATLPHFPLTLVLVSEERESFHELSRWKETLGSRLRSKPLGPLLKETFRLNHYSIADVGFPGLRHFVFKSKSSLQYTSPTIQKEVGVEGEDATFYYRHYQDLQDRLYARGTPSTLHYHGCKRQITFGWVGWGRGEEGRGERSRIGWEKVRVMESGVTDPSLSHLPLVLLGL